MTKLCLALSALLYLGLIVLALRPGFDLEIARVFYAGPDHFIGDTRAGTIVRFIAWSIPFATMLFFAVAKACARVSPLGARFAPSGRGLLFLFTSLALAPGLIVHATLKEISHRPRPYSVTAFGGADTFRPFYRFDDACDHNCSFPSGETAAATWMIAPASLAPLPWRGAALAAAVLFAGATGLLRMAFGAHFLSDVAAAALITTLVVLASRALLRAPARQPLD